MTTHNFTYAYELTLPYFNSALEYYIAPDQAIMNFSDFQDGEILSTLTPAANLTIYVDEINGTEAVYIESYGTEVMIITPPAYACNLVIYGVDGVFQTPPAVPFGQALVRYLEYILMPGGAEVPAQLIVDLVAANQTDEVAAAFDEAASAGYPQQLVAILQQAVTIPAGFDALAAVANQMIVQSSCSTLAPIIQALFQIYPTIQDLDLSSAQLAEVQHMKPQLVSCIVSSIA